MSKQKHKSVEWYSPQWVFAESGLSFDLDPCHPGLGAGAVVPCRRHFTRADDGLIQPWHGSVWLNPPYDRAVRHWMHKFVQHANGVAMVFARSDAAWFQECLQRADAALFLAGRVEFIPGQENADKDSRAGAATAMFAFGADNVRGLRRLAHRGTLFVHGHIVLAEKNPSQGLLFRRAA